MRSQVFTAMWLPKTLTDIMLPPVEHTSNRRVKVFLKTLKGWLKRSLSVGLYHSRRTQVPIFFANYIVTWSIVINTTPYTLDTGRACPHSSRSEVMSLLDADVTASGV
ncbi:hypothetical protein SARC_05718 [Sphaeroforma arctica JP610]|uniref:Uncharacterized protein n=1 Tax=Sphaeroforma arctica JP610 TaxID=667725 RepID=A0A0L0FZD1_9EUKA|nr:hypothetical protein SARC_05718 [Sphaeroforma arctica JP610]KNC81989.1 hypothetical protein SARC_05718 [Sphaeroforma arctica JP610]|eukprot:XP_014155891.1 hypothetical protein SARC_05718 [Sphaeroforma arctica JP610]